MRARGRTRLRSLALTRRSIFLWLDQRNPGGSDFTQRHDNFLIIGFDQRTRALEKLLGAAGCAQNQFKTVWDNFEAVLYGDSRHDELIFRPSSGLVNAGEGGQ